MGLWLLQYNWFRNGHNLRQYRRERTILAVMVHYWSQLHLISSILIMVYSLPDE